LIIPIFILFIFSYISNAPTPENEYLTNLELAKKLELDNYTIEHYVVGLRARVSCALGEIPNQKPLVQALSFQDLNKDR